jgi:L-ascorbate metabolism protein UlaG (beta-lactamase superfamily)
MTNARTLLLTGALALSSQVLPADVDVEYIAHACFVVTSSEGTRVVIDPYNSSRWLGYHFPDSVEADVVLVTHPHYDHDASYYWGDSTPVFREPGSARVGDVELLGVEGRHAGPYGKEFGQRNTIWLLDTGGVRIAHLGDNGPLTEANVRELGRVDVLMVPADGDDHILKKDEIVAIRRQLGEPLVIPMHYRLDGLRGLPRSIGPIDPWLAGQPGVVRLDSNTARLSRAGNPDRKVLVFSPSPELVPWSDALTAAWEALGAARKLMAADPPRAPEAAALVKQAADSADGIVFSFQWARVLTQSRRTTEAIRVLERALVRAGRDDWEYRMQARSLLAELYVKAGRSGDAAAQYRLVRDQSYRLDLIEKANAFLEK